MAKILSIISLIAVVVLFPPAVLAFISNNAVPGDSTYPIKRGLENGILAVASVNPVTKAWFSVQQSDRRFQETTTLIAQGNSYSKSLDDLVAQTEVAAKEVDQVSSPQQKQQLIAQLSQSIEKYDTGLAKVEQTQEASPAKESHTTPTPGSVQETNVPTAAPTVTVVPSQHPTSIPHPSVATAVSPTRIPSPTSLPSPTITPRPVQPVPTPVSGPSADIERARQRLEEIQKSLENHGSNNEHHPETNSNSHNNSQQH